MKVEFLNPFVRSVAKNIEANLSERPKMERAFLRDENPFTTEQVAIVIGVTGHLAGQVVISMSEKCAVGIAALMMMEKGLSELNECAQSAIAEMGNMITANATIGLAEAGYKSDITPATVITGRKMEVSMPSCIRTVVIPLSVSSGNIEVNLSLIESAKLAIYFKEKEFKAEAVPAAV